MPRFCIICGASANSREHIFPAALGGLRVNRGIYCEAHNNAFSGLANALTQQFGMWSSLLGVRDRDRRPRVHHTSTPEGEAVVVTTGRVRRVNTSPAHPEGGVHLHLTLGGPEGLPAVAYVALTFFAHHFSDLARDVGFTPVKEFIQGRGENSFVWWESDNVTRGLPRNPFAFGHTIILTTTMHSGEARALVSLFQTLTFGVDLGHSEQLSDRTVTVFIDPHAERQPLDTVVQHSSTVDYEIEPPDPMHAHLERMVFEGQGQDLMAGLLARIERWHFENEMSAALERLNATRHLPTTERLRAIQHIVFQEMGRVHRVMRHVVRGMRSKMEANPEFAPVMAFLESQVSLNDARTNINEEAEIPVMRVVAAFIVAINSKLADEPVNMDYLWSLFSGSQGAVLATETMTAPILSVLREAQEQAK